MKEWGLLCVSCFEKERFERFEKDRTVRSEKHKVIHIIIGKKEYHSTGRWRRRKKDCKHRKKWALNAINILYFLLTFTVFFFPAMMIFLASGRNRRFLSLLLTSHYFSALFFLSVSVSCSSGKNNRGVNACKKWITREKRWRTRDAERIPYSKNSKKWKDLLSQMKSCSILWEEIEARERSQRGGEGGPWGHFSDRLNLTA